MRNRFEFGICLATFARQPDLEMLDLEASALFIKLRYYSGRQMGVEQLICSLGYAGCCDQSQSLHIRSVSYHQITARGQLRSLGTQVFAIFEFRFFGLELQPLLYLPRLVPRGL